MKKIRRFITIATLLLSAAAIYQEWRKPRADRTWTGDILGVPYDFRKPSLDRFVARWWNPEDERLFTPRDFGVGWAVNLHRLLEIASGSHRPDGDEVD